MCVYKYNSIERTFYFLFVMYNICVALLKEIIKRLHVNLLIHHDAEKVMYNI